eukprot:1104471-Alexandrium_andersonii.AAC.1
MAGSSVAIPVGPADVSHCRVQGARAAAATSQTPRHHRVVRAPRVFPKTCRRPSAGHQLAQRIQ